MLGNRFTVSESAVGHLFVNLLLQNQYVGWEQICPEDYYVDRAGIWRRVDLLIGKDLLFDTGKRRAVRSRMLAAAAEYKVESEAVTIKPSQVEDDAKKLQGLADDQMDRLRNFNVLVLLRAKRSQLGLIGMWKEMSSRYRSVRFVIAFADGGNTRVLHFHRGKLWDVGRNNGQFYEGWELNCTFRDFIHAMPPG